tara:strand:+ start:1625 stop:1834 length:210 start_codon:yes stop_codon:yes gene_type:complete
MSEHLDIKNVIEVDRIRTILREHPDLLSLFEILIIIANNRINDEKTGIDLPIEDNIEPELSDHESDEET